MAPMRKKSTIVLFMIIVSALVYSLDILTYMSGGNINTNVNTTLVTSSLIGNNTCYEIYGEDCYYRSNITFDKKYTIYGINC